MKKDIILAGVGGQGILSIAAAIGLAAVKENLYIKQSEVHGMSQQGGEVYSHLRLSSRLIWSDLIPKGAADIILAVEPLEALRYLNYLDKQGWIISSSEPMVNIRDYPETENVLKTIRSYPHYLLVDALKIAKESGNAKGANMVMLGAASPFLNLQNDSFIHAITSLFSKKGAAVVEANIQAFLEGRSIAVENNKS